MTYADSVVRLFPALVLLCAGCASIPAELRELPAGQVPVELTETAFYPQGRYQCGPAALATVLDASGVEVSVPALIERVYVPDLQGSLQVELLAATRSAERVPYLLEPGLAAIIAELEAGRPVLVLQNLGVSFYPRWHYAVVVGIDPERRQVVLRSGIDARRETALNTFVRTWARSDYWAFVVLRPDELPARLNTKRYRRALVALEQTGFLQSAASGWENLLSLDAEDTVALFGLGNVRLAERKPELAETAYRRLLELRPDMVVARNNLAIVLSRQGRTAEALDEITVALAGTDDATLRSEFERTRREILSASH